MSKSAGVSSYVRHTYSKQAYHKLFIIPVTTLVQNDTDNIYI